MLKPLLPDSPRQEIEEYVEETHRESLAASEERRRQSELNWLYYLNKQNQYLDGTQLKTFWEHPAPYRTENVLRGALDTQVGRMVKDLPDAVALPTTPEAVARFAAEKAQDLIEYWSFENDLDREDSRVCLWGYLSGCAGYKVVYDPSTESIRFLPLKLWEFLIDMNAPDVDGARWVTFIDHVTHYDALAMANEALAAQAEATGQPFQAITEGEIDECDYSPGVGREKRRGVRVEERWEVPHPRCPKGLYLKIIGGRLVEAREFPNMLPAREARDRLEPYLPIVLWSPGEADDGPLGSTPVDDAVVAQRLHNETISHIAQLTRISADLRLYGPDVVIKKVQAGKNQYIECPDPSQIPKWGEPPKLSPALFTAKEEGPGKIRSLVGVDQDAGQGADQSSARQTAYVEQIDSYKLTVGHRSFQAMVEARYELGLKEAQVFFSERQRVTWPSGDVVKDLAFEGADLDGTTVRLEPRAGREKFLQQKAQGMVERAANGLADPADAARAVETGHAQSSLEVHTEKLVQMEIEEVRAGVEPMLEADPQIALPFLREQAAALAGLGDEEGQEAAETLARLYGQALQATPPAPRPEAPQKRVKAPREPQPTDILPGGPPDVR